MGDKAHKLANSLRVDIREIQNGTPQKGLMSCKNIIGFVGYTKGVCRSLSLISFIYMQLARECVSAFIKDIASKVCSVNFVIGAKCACNHVTKWSLRGSLYGSQQLHQGQLIWFIAATVTVFWVHQSLCCVSKLNLSSRLWTDSGLDSLRLCVLNCTLLYLGHQVIKFSFALYGWYLLVTWWPPYGAQPSFVGDNLEPVQNPRCAHEKLWIFESGNSVGR